MIKNSLSVTFIIGIIVCILFTIIPLELHKINVIKHEEEILSKKFDNSFDYILKDYEKLSKFILLNNIKIFESLKSIEKIANSDLNKNSKYQIDKENMQLSFFYEENKVNFILEDVFNEIELKTGFSLFIENKNKTLPKLDTKKIKEKFNYFSKNKENYVAFYKRLKGVNLIVYKNISNSFLNNIVLKYILLYIFIIILYILIAILLYKLIQNEKKSSSLKYNLLDLSTTIDKYVLMLTTNEDGIITYVSQAFCDWSFFKKDELIGKNSKVLKHPDISEKFDKRVLKILDANPSWEGELKYIDKYGNSLWSKAVSFKNYNFNGRFEGYSTIMVDVSDNKQIIKMNALLKEELSGKLNEIKLKDDDLNEKIKVQLMSKILDSISHQWKKPISDISIELTKFSLNLIDKKEDTQLIQIHKNIDNNLKNLSILLNEFKYLFSKNDQNDKYNVYSSIKDAITSCNNDIKHNNILVLFDAKKDVYCFGVANEIKYIISALLKYSIEQIALKKKKDPKINLSIINDGDDVIIKYQDNVNSFENSIVEEVFSDKNNDYINRDLNVNLNVIKLLIKKTGSTLWFENNNEETIFYLKLISKDRRVKERNN